LAAALVGWANRRAFYLIGGSTPAGYERDAAQWLHWRIMCALRVRGFAYYNLGGTPSSAAQAGDPAHGLYRFKTGFGPEVVSCRSLGWTLSEGHARAHHLVGRLAAFLGR
jgi:lipid II:glycine glycyltransferase (peptidoglycan interpeptide bridge formation enzyme)